MRKILLVNDDGIDSDGIVRLAKAAVEFGEVYVVAPDGQRSAVSHSITLRHSFDAWEVEFPVPGVKAYACDGTPADCARVGILNLVPGKPDNVFSGINYGYNCATDLQYSATAGAAFEAAFQGIPTIAFSEEGTKLHEGTDKYLSEVMAALIDKSLDKKHIWNVNFPARADGILWNRTVADEHFYLDRYAMTEATPGRFTFMVDGILQNYASEGTDMKALLDGYVSVGVAHNIHQIIRANQGNYKIMNTNKKYSIWLALIFVMTAVAVCACSKKGALSVSDNSVSASDNQANTGPTFEIDWNAEAVHALPDDWDKIDEQYMQLINVRDNIYMNDDERFTELTVSLNNIVNSGTISGTLVVATDHEIIFASGTGAYDIYGNMVSMDTTYGIGSINKTFTSACIMKLMEEGRLSLDDTIDMYFPDYKYGNKITIYDLLHMCSGLKGIGLSKGPETTREDRYNMVKYGEYYDDYFFYNCIYPSELDFEPGTDMRYCNTNYFLLANIIEIVSGQSYGEYVTANIIDPLNLDHTSLGCVKDITSQTENMDPDFTPDYMATMEKTLKGYGAMHSTPLDILMFDRALFNNKLFSDEATLDTMLEMKYDYGCGWISESSKLCHYHQGDEPSTTMNVYHDGSVYCFRASNCVLNVNGERVYIIWCNSSSRDLDVLIYDACQTYVEGIAAGE